MKILYVLFTVLAVVLFFSLMGEKTEITVDEISIFGDNQAMSGEIISGTSTTGDIFGEDAAVQGNVFGDLGST
ncbi:MAG: hypothetical protein GOU98_01875 [Candidatus Altiarchaeota archaeon]|nr:hypothetical protein [Candidatus Altiarchaeota archaeon]